MNAKCKSPALLPVSLTLLGLLVKLTEMPRTLTTKYLMMSLLGMYSKFVYEGKRKHIRLSSGARQVVALSQIETQMCG